MQEKQAGGRGGRRLPGPRGGLPSRSAPPACTSALPGEAPPCSAPHLQPLPLSGPPPPGRSFQSSLLCLPILFAEGATWRGPALCNSVRLCSAVQEWGAPHQSRRPSLQQLLEWQSPQEAPPTLSPSCQEEIAFQSCQVLGQVGRSPHLRRERVMLVSAGHLEDVRRACIGPGR